MPTPIKTPATVVEVVQHSGDLWTFTLKPARRVPAFAPGQFLHLALDRFESGSHWPDSRVFSIASSPKEREHLRITISRQGHFTARMFTELRVGSAVWLKLPYGDFVPSSNAPGRIVMLAGGSGITPFMSYIEWAVTEQPAATIDLHYGARSADLLIYRAALERCSAQSLRDLRVRYYVEQPSAEPGVVHGRLSAEQAWSWLDAPHTCRFYLSGPKIMIDTLRANLVQLGADSSAVLSDDWS